METLKKSKVAVKCYKCGKQNPYKVNKCQCGVEVMGEILTIGPDCTACKLSTPNVFGNGDVFCAKKVEGNTGVGVYCDLFEKGNSN